MPQLHKEDSVTTNPTSRITWLLSELSRDPVTAHVTGPCRKVEDVWPMSVLLTMRWCNYGGVWVYYLRPGRSNDWIGRNTCNEIHDTWHRIDHLIACLLLTLTVVCCRLKANYIRFRSVNASNACQRHTSTYFFLWNGIVIILMKEQVPIPGVSAMNARGKWAGFKALSKATELHLKSSIRYNKYFIIHLYPSRRWFSVTRVVNTWLKGDLKYSSCVSVAPPLREGVRGYWTLIPQYVILCFRYWGDVTLWRH